MIKKIIIPLVVIFSVILNLSCGKKEKSPQPKAEVAQATPETVEYGDTCVIGTIGDADSLLDWNSTTAGAGVVIGLLFQELTFLDKDMDTYKPAFAKSWEFSEDHKELTFHLRNDVYWTDGVQTTAHDVEFTFRRQKDPNVAWSAISWKDFIDRVEVIDDYTVKFIFNRVYPYQLMDASVGAILPRHLLENVPVEELNSCDFNRNPVGNGPFKLKKWMSQQYIELAPNGKYYKGRPPLDRIIFKIVPNQANLIIQLKSKEIDMLEQIPPREYETLKKIAHLTEHRYPSRFYTYIGWNLTSPLFENKRVRQALTMAINRKEIVDSLLFGLADVCNGPVAPIMWAYDPDLPDFSYDSVNARKILAEEGWRDSDGDGWLDKEGRRFEFTLKTNKGNQVREDITVLVQSQLKEVGIKVNPLLLEWTIFSDDLNKKNFEAAVAGWSIGLKMDFTDLWHSSSIPKGFNFVSYSNPEVDRLNDLAKVEMDREKAKELWRQAQRIIVEDQPYTFLYIPEAVNFIHRRFRNVQMETVSAFYNLDEWWAPKKEQLYP